MITGLPPSGKAKRNFFQVREKSGNFVDGQGNSERTWKIRKILKINDYGRQSSENLFCLGGERMYNSHEMSKPIFCIGGYS